MRRKLGVVAALALVATMVVFMAPPTASAQCVPGRLVAGRRIQTDIFACAGVVRDLPLGAFSGGRVRIPLVASSGLAALGYIGVNWGRIEKRFGKRTRNVKETRMRAFVKSWDVPWPRKDSKTAKRHRRTRYSVYRIWYTDHRTARKLAWKYGITRKGKARPESQLPTCNGHPDTVWLSCKWKWLRVRVKGYYRARAIEAAYAARFKARTGHCPIGMKSCI